MAEWGTGMNHTTNLLSPIAIVLSENLLSIWFSNLSPEAIVRESTKNNYVFTKAVYLK